MQNKGGKYNFEGLHPLNKFVQFSEIEDADAANVVVEEEYNVEVARSKSADDDVYFVNLAEHEDVENDPLEQVNLLTRRRRRRDPRPGVVICEPETEHVSVTQIQTTTTELTEPSPQVRESVAGSSSHIEDLDYDSFLAIEQVIRTDRGKNVLPKDEPIDIVKLQSIQKLQDKFKGEFADESSPLTTSEPTPGISQAEFDELTRTHEEGDRSGIVCWGYDEVKEMSWLKRKLTKRIENYDHPSSFKSLTVVDMVELARQRFFNPSKKKRGENFYNFFSHMTLAKSVKIKKKTNYLRNPIDIDVYETYGMIINCGNFEYTFYDPTDLMCLSEKDIKFLNNQEMKVDQDHLEDLLEIVVYARVIVKNKAWSGGKRDSSTLMSRCGESDESAKEKSAEETQN
ncbi:hypothetical protein R6Q57_020531 [Mikania cordata]